MEKFSLHDALKLAVTTEQIGAKMYDRFAKKYSGNKEVAEVFARLAKDERIHESQFKVLLDSIPQDDAGRYGVEEYLKATAISEFFSDKAQDKLDDIASPQDALQKAFALEKATLLFYHAIKDSLGDNTALDDVIAAEKGHAVSLMNVLIADSKFRGIHDKW